MAFPFIKLSNSNGPVVTGISHTKTKSLPGVLAGVRCRGCHNSTLSSPRASLDPGATAHWRKTLPRPIDPPHPSQGTRYGPRNQWDAIITDMLQSCLLCFDLSYLKEPQIKSFLLYLGLECFTEVLGPVCHAAASVDGG